MSSELRRLFGLQLRVLKGWDIPPLKHSTSHTKSVGTNIWDIFIFSSINKCLGPQPGLILMSSSHRSPWWFQLMPFSLTPPACYQPAFYYPAVLSLEIVKGQALQKYADIAC